MVTKSQIIFTLKIECGIILVVKRLALLAVPLLAAVSIAGGISANAAAHETEYPKDEDFTRILTLTSLNDYAIEDGLYAFADGEFVKVFSNGNYDEYETGGRVTDVEIKDGVIYYGYGDKAYSLSDMAECEHAFSKGPEIVFLNNFHYYFKDGALKIFDESSETVSTYEGYSILKEYGGKAYAVKDNVLYEFAGAAGQEVALEYEVKPGDIEITIGKAANNLKTYGGTKFVNIAADSYLTEIDLEKLDGQSFVPLDIVKTAEKSTALLLCYSGNAAIVSVKDKAYAVLKDKVSEISLNPATDNPYTTAQMIGMNIYASPFVVSGTVANSNALGITVKVLNKIENDVLESVFYEVEYGEDNSKGYVAEGFLAEVIIGDNIKPEEITDPEFSEDSDTKTILIILAVILLVLAALAYILYVSGKGKKKEKDKQQKEEEKKE